MGLTFTPKEMKGDRELCMAAVAQDGKAIEHASEAIKNDEEVVRVAVHQRRLVGKDIMSADWRDLMSEQRGISKAMLAKVLGEPTH